MAVTNADILGWFNANPNADDALIVRTMQDAGVTPARLAQVTGAPLAEVVNRFQAAITAPAAPVDPTAKLFQDTLGRAPTQEEIDRFGGDIKAGQLSSVLGYARNEAVNTLPKTGAASNIARQILAQGTTDKWVGEGYGSATKNAYDMGVMLAGQGITDINQFGQRTTSGGGQEYFNKATGEAIKPFYDRAGGNIWGGTFAGKDSTAYGVEFDASGKPLFYSQSGGDSSDVPSWVKPALVIGGALYGLNTLGLFGGGAAGAGSLTAGVTAESIAASDALLSGSQLLSGTTAGGLGTGFTAAGLPSGVGTFLGEGALSGIAASDAALAGATVGSTGLTMAQLAELDLALGGAGGTAGAETLASALTTGATVPTLTNLTGGSGLLTGAAGGITPASVASSLAGGGAASTLGGAATGALTSTLPAGVTSALTNAGVSTAVNNILGGGGTSNIGSILNTGLTTGAGLLQQQTSREAAQRAQAMIDRETAAAKASAAFRPVGMTTRFGTSQFQVDPVTGQLTSAGYTLSPEAKAQQDRFMALSNAGLTQAEQAQQQFAPLQTGAQRLFGLGNQYLAESPEAVAQNYLNQQMALLQPGRELELANLQNRLQQQGRGGLSVAQGGTLGATTPELQALYNARATQEAQLAAQAQQAGQQQVTFGAGLLGQGAGAMGQYYAGQQASYAPYTTAMGQAQALEAAGQQPFTLSSQLGQTAATAGARAGALGLEGANISQRLATGAAATTNPYATALGGVSSNPAFGQLLGGLFGSGAPVNALSSSAYGPGNAGFQNMLNDIYG